MGPIVELVARKARAAFERGASREALVELDRAARLAAEEGDRATALGLRLAGLQIRGEVEGPAEAPAALEALAEEARTAGLDELFALATLESAEQLRALERYREAAQKAQALLEWATPSGRPEIIGAAALSLALTLRASGRIAETATVLNRGLFALARPSGEAEGRVEASPLLPALPDARLAARGLLLQLARVSLELDLPPRARECLDKLATVTLDPAARVLAASLGVELARQEGRQPSLDELRAAVAELERRPPSRTALRALLRLATLEQDPARALEAIGRAESVGARLPERAAAAAEVAVARASVLLAAGRLVAARAALPDPADLPSRIARIDRALLSGTIALAAGQPSLAIATVLEAAAMAEASDDVLRAASAHHIAAALHRQVGIVDAAASHRLRAAELYHRAGLRGRLAALEVERAWVALIEGQMDEAATALAPLLDVQDLEVAAQVALCRGALALATGRPGEALSSLCAVHDRLVAASARLAALALGRAARRLAEAAGAPLPEAVASTLGWGEAEGVPAIDPLAIPKPSTLGAP